MAKPMIVIALACILAPAIGHAQESDTLLDDLCVQKIRFCNIGGEGRRELGVT